jgi:hypothetical protein
MFGPRGCPGQALAGSLADERQLAQFGDVSLCHGWAGLLQTTWRVASDADGPERFAVPRLLRRLEQHLHHHGPPAHDGLLEGMAGVQLVRHALEAGVPPASGWDACLLLYGGRTSAAYMQRINQDLSIRPVGPLCRRGNHE